VDHLTPSSSWHDWIAQHASRFLLYARQQTRSAADAEDVVQEALIESWRRCAESTELPAPALVFATIRRRAIDLVRSVEARGRREQEHAALDAPWFSSGDGQNDADAELERAVKNLPPIYQEVVTLKVWGRLTFQEIAATLDVPLNTAASRYRYGLDRLREMFKEVAR
jgi:RNA polymerase sigma-70 factor, ECF subfamily